MNSLLNRFRYFFSGKLITFLILLLVIVGKILQLIFLFNIRADRSHQMLATQNFVNGHGISKAFVYANDLSSIIYEPLTNWPPGYSILLSPFYLIFKGDYILAGLTLDILCAIALLFITRKILNVLGIPGYLVKIFTLLTGFFLYPFFTKMSSDAIAITFFLWAISFVLQLLTTPHNKSLQRSICAGLCLVICASIKFLYIPLIAIIPAVLLIKGFIDKNRLIKKTGFIVLSIVLAGTATVLLYQKNMSGNFAHIAQSKQGIFTENLLLTYPTIPASFINPETAGQLLHQPYDESSKIYLAFQYIHILLFISLLVISIVVAIKKGFKNLSALSLFFYLLFFLSIAVTLLLSFLSIKYAKELDIWTYVQEARYYGVITVMIQLAVFILFHQYRAYDKSWIKFIPFFFIILLLPEAFRGILFSANRITRFKKESYTWQTELKIQQFAQEIIAAEKKLKPVSQVVLTGSSMYTNNRISLYSHLPVLANTGLINNPASLQTKTSVLLLIVLREDARKEYEPFLSLPQKKEAGQIEGFYFYTLYVEPH